MFDDIVSFTTPEEVLAGLSARVRQRRLEKGLSRTKLQQMTGVPAPTIAKFENDMKISLTSFVKIAMALGYIDELESLLRESKYGTMEELESIRRNHSRQRGGRK